MAESTRTVATTATTTTTAAQRTKERKKKNNNNKVERQNCKIAAKSAHKIQGRFALEKFLIFIIHLF